MPDHLDVDFTKMLAAWALGSLVVGFMVLGERMTAQRFTAITDGHDAQGTVTHRGLSGGRYKSVVFSVAYLDRTGTSHTIHKVPLTGHVAIGDRIALRYRPDAPDQAAPAPHHVRSNRVQMIVAAVLFAALGVVLGLVV